MTVTKGDADRPLGNLLVMTREEMLAAFADCAPTVNQNLANSYRERR